MDYLVSAVEHLTEGTSPPTDRDLKYAVLHLQAATEVLLKARLVREHWSLVFKDPGKASQASYKSGNFESCNITATIERLDKVAGVVVSQEDRSAIKSLADTRNALTHYGHSAPAYAVEARAGRVLDFLITFIHEHLHPALSSDAYSVARTIETLRARLGRIEALVTDRMRRLSAELARVVDRTVLCPDCRQWALVVGSGNPVCKFCLQDWSDPFDAAFNYVINLGEDDHSLEQCPACGNDSTVVTNLPVADDKQVDIALCFHCATKYEGMDY
jgi:hypothetical protein